MDTDRLVSNGKLNKIASIFRAKKSLQERNRAEGKSELGYEMLYYFLQYTKAKQVQLLREVKLRVLSLDQDLATVRKRLEASTGIGLLDPTTGGKPPWETNKPKLCVCVYCFEADLFFYCFDSKWRIQSSSRPSN